MKSIFTILIIIISITIQAQKNNIREEYYKHLVFRETPYANTVGRIPISFERSKNENHYKLSYNAKNQLVLIEYRLGEILIDRKKTGIMDGFRNLASKIKIEYINNMEIRTFYDVDDIQCRNGMNVYKEVYEYNIEGKRVGVRFFDENNNLKNNIWNIAEYIWITHKDNSVIEKRKNNMGEYVTMRPYYKFYTTKYKYSNQGILISMNHIDSKNQSINDETGVAIDKAEYDSNLNLISFKFYNAQNEPVIGSFLQSAGGSIEYDKNGNCIKYSTINLENKLMISRERAYDIYKFDAYGNVIEKHSYDTNNELIKIRNILKTKFSYDKNKPFRLIKTEYYHE